MTQHVNVACPAMLKSVMGSQPQHFLLSGCCIQATTNEALAGRFCMPVLCKLMVAIVLHVLVGVRWLVHSILKDAPGGSISILQAISAI